MTRGIMRGTIPPGRLSSGKSTLVNALIGRRVARTDVAECTRLVTRFRYGTADRVEVVIAVEQQFAEPGSVVDVPVVPLGTLLEAGDLGTAATALAQRLLQRAGTHH